MTDKIEVWNGVLKCETCKLETCDEQENIQDVCGIDCGFCEDYIRSYTKTILRVINRPFRNVLFTLRVLKFLEKRNHWTLANKWKWIMRRF